MYQDVWVKGRVIIKGVRDCEGRYMAIRNELRRLGFPGKNGDRPFTVLDIGAGSGYFSFRLAEEFNARVTMIE